MTEEAITQGGSSTRKNIQQETGFSEELKQRLQERIAETAFKNENAAAISYANLPVSSLSFCFPGMLALKLIGFHVNSKVQGKERGI